MLKNPPINNPLRAAHKPHGGGCYPFMSLSSSTSPQSISAVRNKMEDIVWQKSCFWEENLLTLHTYH